MSKNPDVLDNCGSSCPKKLAQLAQADLLIQARMFRFGGQWRMLVSISDLTGKQLLEDKVKGTVEQIETQLKQQAPRWFKNILPTVENLSKSPLRIHCIQRGKYCTD